MCFPPGLLITSTLLSYSGQVILDKLLLLFFSNDSKVISDISLKLHCKKWGVKMTPVGVKRGLHRQVLKLHPRV